MALELAASPLLSVVGSQTRSLLKKATTFLLPSCDLRRRLDSNLLAMDLAWEMASLAFYPFPFFLSTLIYPVPFTFVFPGNQAASGAFCGQFLETASF